MNAPVTIKAFEGIDFRSFSGYARDESKCPEFGKFNLLYGLNAAGKTTLTEIFRAFDTSTPTSEDASLFPGAFSILLSDGSFLTQDEIAAHPLHVRVFNKRYIEKNVFTDPITPNEMNLILGEKNIDLERQHNDKKQNLEDAGKDEKRCLKSLNDFESNQAVIIKNAVLGVPEFQHYNKNLYAVAAKKLKDIPMRLFSDTDREKLSIDAKSTAPEEIPPFEVDGILLPTTAQSSVKEILAQKIDGQRIKDIMATPVIEEWVQSGLKIHKDKPRICLFCTNPIEDERIKDLEAHFNEEYQNIQSRVGEEIEKIKKCLTILGQIEIPVLAKVRGAKPEMCQNLYDAYETCKEDYVQFMNYLMKMLATKRATPFKELEMEGAVPESVQDKIAEINQEIRTPHNLFVEQHATEKLNAAKKYEQNQILSTIDKYQEHQKLHQAAKETCERLQQEINSLKIKIAEGTSPEEAAVRLGKNLKTFLRRKEFSFRVVNNRYKMERNGEPATHLSEGEKTAIALLYFLESLSDESFDKAKGIVVIDDPISSLDTYFRHRATEMISAVTKDVGQAFILTHDLSFYRLIKGRELYQNGISHEVDFSPSGGSAIKEMAATWAQYGSKYHHNFCRLKKILDTDDLKDYENIPNFARRVLEKFTYRRFPSIKIGIKFHILWRKYIKPKVVEKLADEKIETLYKLLGVESHTPVGDEDETSLREKQQEIRSVLQDVFSLMEALDKEQYEEMCVVYAEVANKKSSPQSR